MAFAASLPITANSACSSKRTLPALTNRRPLSSLDDLSIDFVLWFCVDTETYRRMGLGTGLSRGEMLRVCRERHLLHQDCRDGNVIAQFLNESLDQRFRQQRHMIGSLQRSQMLSGVEDLTTFGSTTDYLGAVWALLTDPREWAQEMASEMIKESLSALRPH